jgi:hypothetical protein
MGAPAVKEAVFHVAFTKYSSRSLLRESADVKEALARVRVDLAGSGDLKKVLVKCHAGFIREVHIHQLVGLWAGHRSGGYGLGKRQASEDPSVV